MKSFMQNSLRKNIKVTHMMIVLFSSVGISILIYIYASQVLGNYVKSSLQQIAVQGAEIVSRDLDKNLSFLETLAKMDIVQNPNISIEEKLNMLNTSYKTDELLRISIADVDGNSRTTDQRDLYIGDRAYYQRAIQGEKNISDPVVSRVDGTYVVTFAVPVYYEDQIVYVLYATYPVEALSKMTDEVKLGDSVSMIINGEGTIIAHDNRALVYAQENYRQRAEKDQKYTEIATVYKEIADGGLGVEQYTSDGEIRYMGYASIKGTGWSIAICAPKKTVFGQMEQVLSFIVAAAIVASMILLGLNYYMEYLKRKLTQEEKLSHHAIHAAKSIIIAFRKNGEVIRYNEYAEEIMGYKADAVIGKMTIFDLIEADSLPKVSRLIHDFEKKRQSDQIEFAVRSKDGKELHMVWNIQQVEEQQPDYLELMGMDITQRVRAQIELQEHHEELVSLHEELIASEEELKQQFDQLCVNQELLRKSEERYELAVNVSQIGIWDWNFQTEERFYSDTCYEIFGLQKNDSTRSINEWYERIHPEDRQKMDRGYINTAMQDFDLELRVQTGDGCRWIYAVGKTIQDHNGKAYRMAGAFMDITQKKEAEEKIRRYAYVDELTGLPNRISFMRSFEANVKEGDTAALLFMDLDNFKLVNDSYGHDFGDLLLYEVGKRICAMKGFQCTAARLGGDEYGILLMHMQDPPDVEKFCHALIEQVAERTYEINHIHIQIEISIGIALYPENGACFEELLKHGDTAMYRAKKSPKNKYMFFTQNMNDEAVERMQVQSQLRNALANDEFVLYYQPQFGIKEDRITGFEALIRWNNPQLGFVPPNKFIEIAEETHVIIPLGYWILERACRFMKEMNEKIGASYTISVNISILQLLQEDFVERIIEILDHIRFDPSLLELEITETILMQSFDAVMEKLNQLRSVGIKIALDDFGKGYSSLSYLRQLPISVLKIDKSFVDHIEDADEKDTMIASIIFMAHKMGLSIVGEGVETQKQLEYLKQCKCDKIQGYLFSRPVPEEQVYKLIG